MTPPTDFYITGGALSRDAVSYVHRQADELLYSSLLQGEFCAILTSRQMGKSSLMVRTAARLNEHNVRVAIVDLTSLGQNLTVEQWYKGTLNRIGQWLDLEEEIDVFWYAQSALPPLERWLAAILKVILARVSDPIVLFFDEIDMVRSLPFRTDEFFAGIRACYNRREHDPAFRRLTFCLLGVVAPSELIEDSHITPFNIGKRIELDDFTLAEAQTLTSGISVSGRDATSLLDRVLYWTGGQPYLTQRLCAAVASDETVIAARDIDQLCTALFFTREAQQQEVHLAFVRNRLLKSGEDLAGLLDRYKRVLVGKRVPYDPVDPLCEVFRLAGIIRVINGQMQVRNRIYEEVFNREWVRQNMPDAELRRQALAYRRGVVRALSLASIPIAALGTLLFFSLRSPYGAHKAEDQSYKVLYHFGATSRDGAIPSMLIQGKGDSFLYGITNEGGKENGTVFRINTDGTQYQILHTFGQTGSGDGAFPLMLIQGRDSSLYGTTQIGGEFNSGTLYRLSTKGDRVGYLKLFDFKPGPDGIAPGYVMQGSDGDLYGTAIQGGTNGGGTLFRIDTLGKHFQTLYAFGASTTDCSHPGCLIQGRDGFLYGVARGGVYPSNLGGGMSGTVFKIATDGSGYQKLHDFGDLSQHDGIGAAQLLQGSDGFLYGTTFAGGDYYGGTVYRISPAPNGQYAKLYSFGKSLTDGISPGAPLIQGFDGFLYSTTQSGGQYGVRNPYDDKGTIFRIDTSGNRYEILHSFGEHRGPDGNEPAGALLQTTDGNLYGITVQGGIHNKGTLFKLICPHPPTPLSLNSQGAASSAPTLGGQGGENHPPTPSFALRSAGASTARFVRRGSHRLGGEKNPLTPTDKRVAPRRTLPSLKSVAPAERSAEEKGDQRLPRTKEGQAPKLPLLTKRAVLAPAERRAKEKPGQRLPLLTKEGVGGGFSHQGSGGEGHGPRLLSRYIRAADERGSEPTAMVTDATCNLYVAGFVETSKNDADFLTLKYDMVGHLLWSRRYNGTGNDVDRLRDIAVGKGGNVFVTGESDNGKGNNSTHLSGLDVVTIKYSPKGDLLWKDRYDDIDHGEDRPVKLRVDASGNAYVLCACHRLRNGKDAGCDFVLLKYGPKGGRPKWVERYDGEAHDNNMPTGMVMTKDGSVCVCGYSRARYASGLSYDYLTLKYAPDGKCLWTHRYNAGNNADNFARDIGTDSEGNIYVVGEGFGPVDSLDGGKVGSILVKYSPAGDRLWVHGTTSESDRLPHMTASAFRADGSVMIAGPMPDQQVYRVVVRNRSGKAEHVFDCPAMPCWIGNAPCAVLAPHADHFWMVGTQDEHPACGDFVVASLSLSEGIEWRLGFDPKRGPNFVRAAVHCTAHQKEWLVVVGQAVGDKGIGDIVLVRYQ